MSKDARTSWRSRADLAHWGTELAVRWGAAREHGFHVVVWDHDENCPLNPVTNTLPELKSECHCQPDGTLVLRFGTAEQRRIPVVRAGVALAGSIVVWSYDRVTMRRRNRRA